MRRWAESEVIAWVFIAVLFVVLAIGVPTWAALRLAEQRDEQTAQLEAQCEYVGQRIATGWGGGPIEMWNCAGASYERRAPR